VSAASLLWRKAPVLAGSIPAKPNSKWAGVQLGMNVPLPNFSAAATDVSADEILDRCVRLGISAVELRSQPVEAFLGSPAAGGTQTGGSRAGAAPTPEQEAAQKAAADTLRKWRLAVSMSKVKELRRKYESAGVAIEIAKFDGIGDFTDDVIDYCFQLAKTLGARAISTEIALPHLKRLGQFADRHKMMIGYHGHAMTTPSHWEEAFGYAKYNGANLDLGNFLAGNKTSPIPFLERHHDRITHIHVKDRKLNGPGVAFGQGDVPIREALHLIRNNKWKIQGTIEFEYPIPQGSDRMIELAKCVEYCKQCLLT
jgi:sugar phosphate isomerase/epimerase